MAEIQAINVADAATAISAMMAPEQGQAEVDEAQPAEVSDEDIEAAASGDDDSGVEDAPDDESAEEQSEESEESEEQEQPQTFTVKVDGKEVDVTLDELQKGYSRTQDYTRKTQQIAEVRKQVEQETQAVRAERQQYAQLLGALQAQLQVSEPQVDLERLYNEDPNGCGKRKSCGRDKRRHTLFRPNSSAFLKLASKSSSVPCKSILKAKKMPCWLHCRNGKTPRRPKLKRLWCWSLPSRWAFPMMT